MQKVTNFTPAITVCTFFIIVCS